MKDKFKLGITCLSVVVILFLFYSLLDEKISTQEIKEGNNTNIQQTVSYSLNKTISEKVPMQSILTSSVAALSAILAIVLVVSQIILSSISDKYTPHILKKYKEDPYTKKIILIFLFSIIFSFLLLIIIEILSEFTKYILFLISVFLFIYSILLFRDYFNNMFAFINPLEFSSILKKEVIEKVTKQDEEVKDYITSIGDVSIKALSRKEEEIAKKYLNDLNDIAYEFLELRRKYPDKYSVESNGLIGYKNTIIGGILGQYYRLFYESVVNGQKNFSIEVIHQLFSLLRNSMFKENNETLIDYIFQESYNFYNLSIEKKDPARFYLIYDLSYTLTKCFYPHNKIPKKLENILIDDFIVNCNSIILENDDFDLFRKELHQYSLTILHQTPEKLQDDLSSSLGFYNIGIYRLLAHNDKIIKKLERLRFMIKYTVIKDFDNIDILNDELEDYKLLILDFFQTLKDSDYSNAQISGKFDEVTFSKIKNDIPEDLQRINEVFAPINNKSDLHNICRTYAFALK